MKKKQKNKVTFQEGIPFILLILVSFFVFAFCAILLFLTSTVSGNLRNLFFG